LSQGTFYRQYVSAAIIPGIPVFLVISGFNHSGFLVLWLSGFTVIPAFRLFWLVTSLSCHCKTNENMKGEALRTISRPMYIVKEIAYYNLHYRAETQ
jgi:hypothetical protein